MSKKTIVEATITTSSGYGAKKGASGYKIENVILNKSRSGSGSSYFKEEKKVTKVSGGRRPWEVDTTNGDEGESSQNCPFTPLPANCPRSISRYLPYNFFL